MSDLRFEILEYLVENDTGDWVDVASRFKRRSFLFFSLPRKVSLEERKRIYNAVSQLGKEGYLEYISVTVDIHFLGRSSQENEQIYGRQDEQLRKSINAKIKQKGYEQYQKLRNERGNLQISISRRNIAWWTLAIALLSIIIKFRQDIVDFFSS